MNQTYPTTEQQLFKKLDLLLQTGKLLLGSMADTNRILRNMKRTAAFLGLPEEQLHIFIDYNMIIVNFGDETHSFSKFQRCEKHGVNFTVISAISKLTFRAVREDYTMEEFEQRLQHIASLKRNYSPRVTALFTGLACGGFCFQFGCDWIAFLYASLAAFLAFRCRAHLFQRGVNHYVATTCAAFIATLIAWLTTYLPSTWTSTPLHPLLACALFIVPGVPIINFVDDMLDNNIRVGLIRFANVSITMIGMAFGIAFALKFCGYTFNFEPDIMNISMRPHHNYWEYAVAAAISGIGFSMIFNIPRRLLWTAAVGAAIAVCTRNIIAFPPDELCTFSLGLGGVIGSLAGSALVSIIAIKTVHLVHTPNHVVSISSVIPMIPGVLMYRGLFMLLQAPSAKDNLTHVLTSATFNIMTATLIILGISIGVAIPNIFWRKYTNKNKRSEFKKQIQQRKERGDFHYLENL